MVYREMGDYLLSSYISGLNIVMCDLLGYKWPLDCPLLSCWSVSGQLKVVHKCACVLTSSCHAVVCHIFADDGA